jgi:hypothetical protein
MNNLSIEDGRGQNLDESAKPALTASQKNTLSAKRGLRTMFLFDFRTNAK